MANEQNLTPFTSSYQPSNQSKRKPKLKSRIKKIINKNFDVFEQKIKEGNYSFWKEALDRAFGKVKETTEIIEPAPLNPMNIRIISMTKEELENDPNVEIS